MLRKKGKFLFCYQNNVSSSEKKLKLSHEKNGEARGIGENKNNKLVAFWLQRFITANSHPLFEDAQATVLVWIKTHFFAKPVGKIIDSTTSKQAIEMFI